MDSVIEDLLKKSSVWQVRRASLIETNCKKVLGPPKDLSRKHGAIDVFVLSDGSVIVVNF